MLASFSDASDMHAETIITTTKMTVEQRKTQLYPYNGK